MLTTLDVVWFKSLLLVLFVRIDEKNIWKRRILTSTRRTTLMSITDNISEILIMWHNSICLHVHAQLVTTKPSGVINIQMFMLIWSCLYRISCCPTYRLTLWLIQQHLYLPPQKKHASVKEGREAFIEEVTKRMKLLSSNFILQQTQSKLFFENILNVQLLCVFFVVDC